ncbi:MAG: outer membrane lipoprotein-sorting protein [Deltaproteobacteria bacterium]|nr:outer membrane lipoprotein-sorting protein [Deltaproteobacteria bacterium]
MTWQALVLAPLFTVAVPAAPVPPCPSSEEKPDLVALLNRTEQLLEGRSTRSTLTMTISTSAWSRALKLKILTRGRDLALIRVVEGAPRETGMMTLKRGEQLWNYLPQAARVMKLPSGMLGDSWMGSDFTNDDLVKGSSIVDDFAARHLGLVEKDGRSAWAIEMTPKAGAKVVWERVEMVLDRESCVPLEERFFDDENKLARRIEFSDIRQVGWRKFPAKLTVVPTEAGRKTSLQYDDLEFDVEIPDETFSLKQLERGR